MTQTQVGSLTYSATFAAGGPYLTGDISISFASDCVGGYWPPNALLFYAYHDPGGESGLVLNGSADADGDGKSDQDESESASGTQTHRFRWDTDRNGTPDQ
jgi:hypothetical protein